MFVLIALAAGLGGGLAYRLLHDKEQALFERQFDDAVAVLEVRVRRAISDRVTTVAVGGELFPFPPGGQVRARPVEPRGAPPPLRPPRCALRLCTC